MIGQLLLAFISTFAFCHTVFCSTLTVFCLRSLRLLYLGNVPAFSKVRQQCCNRCPFATFFVTVLARILSIIKKSSRYYLSGNRNPSFSSGCRNLLYFLPPDHESRQNGCLYGAGNFQDGRCHCTGYYLRFCDTDEMDTEISEMLVGVGLYDLYILYLFHAHVPPTIPTDMLRFLFVPRLFAHVLCNSPLQAQTGTKHERQCAPHDGSPATVCGDSRETALYQYRRFSNDCKEGSTNR